MADSWTCPECGSECPPDLAVCWNCGTTKDGTADPSFRKAVGFNPRCAGCAHLLVGVTSDVCPECGLPIDRGHVDTVIDDPEAPNDDDEAPLLLEQYATDTEAEARAAALRATGIRAMVAMTGGEYTAGAGLEGEKPYGVYAPRADAARFARDADARAEPRTRLHIYLAIAIAVAIGLVFIYEYLLDFFI